MKRISSINLSRISFRSFLLSCSMFFVCANTHAAVRSLSKILTMSMLFVASQTQGNNHPSVSLGVSGGNNSPRIYDLDHDFITLTAKEEVDRKEPSIPGSLSQDSKSSPESDQGLTCSMVIWEGEKNVTRMNRTAHITCNFQGDWQELHINTLGFTFAIFGGIFACGACSCCAVYFVIKKCLRIAEERAEALIQRVLKSAEERAEALRRRTLREAEHRAESLRRRTVRDAEESVNRAIDRIPEAMGDGATSALSSIGYTLTGGRTLRRLGVFGPEEERRAWSQS